MNFSQLFFNFTKKNSYEEEDFIFSTENKQAYDLLEKFFAKNFQSLIIIGEEACGKTFLFNIFSQKFAAKFITKKDLIKTNLAQFFKENNFYILEDIDKINDDELLFHTINSASEAGAFLLMSAQNITIFKLKDLDSRIKNIINAKIQNPQTEMVRMLLIQGFAKRQLKISNEIVNYLTKNLNRNYQEIHNILEKIENFCHKNKGVISLDIIKRGLEENA